MKAQLKQIDLIDNLGQQCIGDFPMLAKTSGPERPVYLDNAATTLKPSSVISAVLAYYTEYTSNVFRGQNRLSERASIAHQDTRSLVASYINAGVNEIIFTSNCTSAINMLANLLAFDKGDTVCVSEINHHSNYLPWLETAMLRNIPLDQDYIFDVDKFEQTLSPNTKLVALSYVSNVTGNVQPLKQIIEICKSKGVYTLIDASQAVAHFSIDVEQLDCDFMVFSAHKMLGPTGVGVLFGKMEILNKLRPVQFGGGMVDLISNEKINYKKPPYCFESGTPPIEGIIGYGAAIKYINHLGLDRVESYLRYLGEYARNKIEALDSIRLAFPIKNHSIPNLALLPVNDKLDVADISRILSDSYNVLVNAGMHCCQPLYAKANLKGAIRASFYIYNTTEDVDRMVAALEDIKYLL